MNKNRLLIVLLIFMAIVLMACPNPSTPPNGGGGGGGGGTDTIDKPPIEMVESVEAMSATTLDFFDPASRTHSEFSGGRYNQFTVYGEAITIEYTLFRAGVYRMAGAEFPWISEYSIRILDESLNEVETYNALIQSNNIGKEYDF